MSTLKVGLRQFRRGVYVIRQSCEQIRQFYVIARKIDYVIRSDDEQTGSKKLTAVKMEMRKVLSAHEICFFLLRDSAHLGDDSPVLFFGLAGNNPRGKLDEVRSNNQQIGSGKEQRKRFGRSLITEEILKKAKKVLNNKSKPVTRM